MKTIIKQYAILDSWSGLNVTFTELKVVSENEREYVVIDSVAGVERFVIISKKKHDDYLSTSLLTMGDVRSVNSYGEDSDKYFVQVVRYRLGGDIHSEHWECNTDFYAMAATELEKYKAFDGFEITPAGYLVGKHREVA